MPDLAVGPCRVDAIVDEASDVKSFHLVPQDGQGPVPTPGCHLEVLLGPGMTRHYSVLNGPGERDGYWIAAKLDARSRGGSRTLYENVAVGRTIEVAALRNNFPLRPAATHHLLLAGGIGITPLLSMARALHAAGKSFALRYFGRSPEAAAFRDAPQREGFGDSASVLLGLSPAQTADHLAQALAGTSPGTHCYVCGPAGFMDSALAEAARRLPAEAIHREVFGAATPVDAAPMDAAADRPFVVRLARGGKDVPVPAGVSVVAALAAAGVAVPVSCEQGVCGTCITRVLDGEPDHRDSFLMDDERAAGDAIALCVSRARSALLVLDL